MISGGIKMFSSRDSEEKKRLKAEKEQKKHEQELLEQRISETLGNVMVFPGSKEEFEDFIGYKTTWINMVDRTIKGVIYEHHRDIDMYAPDGKPNNPFSNYDFEFQKQLSDAGIVAIVDTNYSFNSAHGWADRLYFGMPVAKKQ
jgi:hypothetical protein